MIRSLLAGLILSLSLFGCASTPPAPVDRFYRLQPVSLPAKVFPAGIAVQPFRADSLYAERPLVYSEEARQLRQYHYHLWLYAPAQLVQEHLAASLGGLAKEGGARLEGRIVRFDRVLAGKRSTALVALELRLIQNGRMVLNKTYQAERVAANETVAAHVEAVEQALAAIYAEFLAEAAA